MPKFNKKQLAYLDKLVELGEDPKVKDMFLTYADFATNLQVTLN